MRFKALSLFLIFIVCVAKVNASDFQDLFIGFGYGEGKSIHYNPQYPPSDVLRCLADIEKVEAVDDYYLFSFEYVFFKSPVYNSSLVLNYSFLNSRFHHFVPGDSFPSLAQDGQSPNEYTIIQSKTQHDLHYKAYINNIDLSYKVIVNSFVPFGLSLGYFFSFPIETNLEQTYNLVTPKNVIFTELSKYKYSDDMRTVWMYDEDIPDLHSFYCGLSFNVFTEYTFFDDYKITANFNYNRSLSKLTNSSNWYINSYSVNLLFSYRVF